MKKGQKIIIKWAKVTFLFLFLPILFCILFLDKRIQYDETARLLTLVPNYILFLIGIIGIGMGVIVQNRRGSERIISTKGQVVLLGALFIVLYFVNVYVARETIYYVAYDTEQVRGYAYLMSANESLGYDTYLVTYPNNIPIAYILGRLYCLAKEWSWYPYNAEFLWIQINCGLISIAGFIACLLVEKISTFHGSIWICAIIYIAAIGISPWKTVPYTDTFGIVFPIGCMFFYYTYRNSNRRSSRITLLALTYLIGAIGGFIKPNVYLMLIAVFLVDLIELFIMKRKRWLLLHFTLIVMVILGTNSVRENMVDKIGLEENVEIAATWHHYFYMGLNEQTTGGYNSEDCNMFGEFQFCEREERNKAEIDRALARIEDRGIVGTIYFGLRKMVKSFNDGTFGWATEGTYAGEYAPIATGNRITAFLRDVFWKDSKFSGRVNTYFQLIWIWVLTCIPGICFRREKEGWEVLPLITVFIGLICYLLLFEARARYLICFMPLIIVQAVLGMEQYGKLLEKWLKIGGAVTWKK